MTVHLLDSLSEDDQALPEADLNARRTALAQSLIAGALAEVEHLRTYERAATAERPSTNLALHRCVYELFRQWAQDAEQLFDRLRALKATGTQVPDLERLDRAIGHTLARLKLRPEQVVSATRQALAGQVIPMEELRNELRARVRT